MQLLDRNDEVCVLYEKLNLQRGVMLSGEAELAARDDDIRKLRIVLADMKRQVELGKKSVGRKDVEDSELRLENLKAEVRDARERVAELSQKMETPEETGRTRDLGGDDPAQKELVEKIQSVEEKLAEKEVRYEHVQKYNMLLGC